MLDVSSDKAEPETVSEPAAKKTKLSKHTTMVATANESKEILKDVKIDEDAKTRRQSKQINQLTSKPARLAKHSTMNATVKVCSNNGFCLQLSNAITLIRKVNTF